ncbi:MAG TPA: hypothetical protein VLQ93_10760, partial [Myxococcaceae bacterium]|nr:hypothetical protein [Myxococcaceae bacterium]
GDWQLLPWILPRVPSRDGRRVPNPLPLLDRWKLLTDLRRSLSAPAALLALVGGWLWLPADDVWGWTLGAVLWFCRRPVAYTVRMARSQGSLAAGLRYVLTSAPRVLIGSFLNLAFLLPLSGLALDAIFRALYRLAFDRSRILDWTTHAQASRKVSGLSSFALPEVWGGMALALGILGVLTLFNPEALPWASPPVLAWLPLVAFVRRGRSAPAAREARPAELDWLRTLARRSWELYAQRVPTGRELSWDTAELSPTDLALGLLAPLSAYHLGCLGLDELVSRLGESLAALAEHERHRGHLFARYDARERRPVSPRHISTAESGVLAAALVVLESGLRAARAEGQPARLEAVEAQARALRKEMDFAFLYDGAVDLFHTGYDVESRSLAGAHHGLLASGALLAGFVAIARGQVPLRHWLALLESDQRLRAAGELPTGQSTEHLLPALFLWFPPATLLAQAARTAVDAAFERDAVRGAPQLAVLALRFSPGRALAELRREEARCVHGRCGLLLLAAVANQVCEDILVQHFHQHWQTAWVEALIYETKDAA